MLIGLGGYAGSGKDAFADFLVADCGFEKRFFSWGVSETLLVLNPWLPYAEQVADVWPDDADMLQYAELFALCGGYGGYELFKTHPEVRRLMQDQGTGVGRQWFGENVWIEILDREVGRLLDDGQDVAVTGVRYPNELAWVEGRSGTSLWITRPGYGPINEHSSDNSLAAQDFERVIPNDRTLEDLRCTAKALECGLRQ